MFLCEACHPKNCSHGWIENLHGGSRGPCESCRKVAVCVDCHGRPVEKTRDSNSHVEEER